MEGEGGFRGVFKGVFARSSGGKLCSLYSSSSPGFSAISALHPEVCTEPKQTGVGGLEELSQPYFSFWAAF